MIASDRILGLVVIVVALVYMVSATQIQTSFLTDPVGSKTFPLAVGAIAALCGAILVLKPDPQPDWPDGAGWLRLLAAAVVLVAYCYALKPLGFLIPTAVAAAILAWQITPRAGAAVLTGLGLSVGLFLLFRYGLGLGLVPLPRALMG